MTLSRVINNAGNVRAETRDAVDAAIRSLAYAPNRAARSLAGNDEIHIALLYSNPSSAYLSEFLAGGLDEASRGDHQLIVGRCERAADEVRAAEHCVAIGVHGVVLPPPLCDAASLVAALQLQTCRLSPWRRGSHRPA